MSSDNYDWLEWPEDEEYDSGLGDFLSPSPGFSDDSLRELLDIYGADFLRDIVVAFEDVADQPGHRANRFASAVDAIVFLHDIGVLSFSDVVLYGDESFGVRIGNTP